MRYSNQFLISLSLLFSSYVYGAEFYAEALYWQPSETVDWALTNNLSLPNQVISYKTIAFNFSPGFRVGASIQKNDWRSRILYTKYNTQTNAYTSGNVISAFMPSKFVETFYRTGNINFKIDLNMVDADLTNNFHIGENLLLNPVIGLKGGTINQRLTIGYQGNVSVVEHVTNNFTGIGPKIGVESQWNVLNKNEYQFNLVADFSTSLMWGKWSIHDRLTQSNSSDIGATVLGKRELGALTLQGFIGASIDYNHYSVKLGYEISDWFNQFQVFDNAVGTHTNDLILQGATLALKYRC